MLRSYSHEGFWTVARAARRLRARGWWIRGIDLSVRRVVRFGGIRWKLCHAIYVNHSLSRRVKYVFLWPNESFAAADSRRWRKSGMEGEIRRQLRTLGYRQRPADLADRGLEFEKPLDVGATDLEWQEIRNFFAEGRNIRPVRGMRRSGDPIGSLIDEFPRLRRQGWLAYHLDLLGPHRKVRADGREWTLGADLHWFAREGVSLDVAAESKQKVGREEFLELRRHGFLARLARDLRGRGLRTASSPPHDGPPSLAFMVVGQSNMRPPRATRVLNGVSDWLRSW